MDNFAPERQEPPVAQGALTNYDDILVSNDLCTPTRWGGWIARTPSDHRFRLAGVAAVRDDAVRALSEAVEKWNQLAEHQDHDDQRNVGQAEG